MEGKLVVLVDFDMVLVVVVVVGGSLEGWNMVMKAYMFEIFVKYFAEVEVDIVVEEVDIVAVEVDIVAVEVDIVVEVDMVEELVEEDTFEEVEAYKYLYVVM